MPIKSILQQLDKYTWMEGVVLMITTPFLLFPTVKIEVTFVCLLLLVLLWLLPLFIKNWQLPPATPIDVILLCFILMLLVSIVVTADPDLTLSKTTLVILGLGWWRFLNCLIKSQEWLFIVTAVYIFAAFGFVLLGILNANWLFKIPVLSSVLSLLPAGLIDLPENQFGVHANQLAGTMLFLFPLFLGIIFGLLSGSSGRKSLFFWVGLFGLSAIIILLTQSRTGWLATAGTLLVLSFCWAILLPRTHKLWRWVWLGLGSMVVAGFAGILAIGPQRLADIWQNPSQETAVGNVSSLGFRQEVWRWGIAAVQDFPFTGTGLGAYRHVVRRLYPLDVRPDYDIAHAHNLYLQTALDIGFPGLITYLALIILVFGLLWQIAKQDSQLRPLALGFLGVLLALHIFGIADALALGSKTTILFWIMLGMITAMHRLTIEQPLAND